MESQLPHTCRPLFLDASTFTQLLALQGPSLGLWRAAEVAALREQRFDRPILDLGCGDGLVISMVLPSIEVGVDPDAKALARHRKAIYETVLPCPVEEAGLPKAGFATVVSNSVLEHVPEIDIVLQTVSKVLQPGGRLIFTTPTDRFSRWLSLPISRYAAWRNQGYGHLNLWPASQWATVLQQAGMLVETVRPILRRSLVTAWDVMDLAQCFSIGGKPIVGQVWQRIPVHGFARLGQWASGLDLSAHPAAGGGQLIVARKMIA